MKYHIPPTYTRSHPAVDSWRKEHQHPNGGQLDFLVWLKQQTDTDLVTGNFADGWTIYFNDEVKYTWFLLKWG